jgi:hypothetical protein
MSDYAMDKRMLLSDILTENNNFSSFGNFSAGAFSVLKYAVVIPNVDVQRCIYAGVRNIHDKPCTLGSLLNNPDIVCPSWSFVANGDDIVLFKYGISHSYLGGKVPVISYHIEINIKVYDAINGYRIPFLIAYAYNVFNSYMNSDPALRYGSFPNDTSNLIKQIKEGVIKNELEINSWFFELYSEQLYA